jgi:CheY-like chemotaxis protein
MTMVDERQTPDNSQERKPGQVSILLVDDNPLDARAAIRAARKLQLAASVSVVTDGQAALDHLRAGLVEREPVGLVLLDLDLPGKNGHDVLSEIRSDPQLRTTPVVILTTSSDDADVEGAYQLGANAYVTKPIGLEDWIRLVSTIREFWFSVAVLPPR